MYPNFHTELFGTANSTGDIFYGGSVFSKLEKLSQLLGTELTSSCKTNPKYKGSGGDAGLDLVSFLQIDAPNSSASRIPACFGQCACSHSQWKEKQFDIMAQKWQERFVSLPAYHEMMFVPFSLRSPSGDWDKEYDDEICTIVVDRFRIINAFVNNTKECHSFLSTMDIYSDLYGSFM